VPEVGPRPEGRLAPLELAGAALAALEASRARIDDLNVYPVPDGDTGTNMTLTARAVVDALERDPEVAGWEDLRVDVETTLPVEEADRRLEAFATAWWLEQLPRAEGKLFFTLAFV